MHLALEAEHGNRIRDSERATARTSALEVRDLTVSYNGKPAILAVDMDIPAGSITAIIGPNGAGKSTLIKSALGTVKPLTGNARFFGQPLRVVRTRVTYMPQRSSIDRDFPIRVVDVVMMGMVQEVGWLRRHRQAHRRHALHCLDRVGMADFSERQIGRLSGGQQQRVFLARALAQGADLFLLDEPLAGVDAASQTAIIRVLHALRDEGSTIIAVHHDLASVEAWFDRVLLLNCSCVAQGPVADAFTPRMLARTYGAGISAQVGRTLLESGTDARRYCIN